MARTMSKTANIYTRVDPETKKQAEIILDRLGIPMSNAIGMFLKQIVIQHGIPFEMKLTTNQPLAINELTKEQFDAEMQLAMDDITAGRVLSADEVEEDMRKLYSKS